MINQEMSYLHIPIVSPDCGSTAKGNSMEFSAVFTMRLSIKLGKPGKLTSTGPSPWSAAINSPVVLCLSAGETILEVCSYVLAGHRC